MRRARIDPKARGIVCAVKRANVIWGKGSADNIRASGASKPASTGRRHDRTQDQTQRRKKTLDQRAPSRHDNALECAAWMRDGEPSFVQAPRKPLTIERGGRGYGRYVAFQMAEVAIPRNLFADILRLIAVAPDRSFEVSKREPFMLVHRYSAPEQTKTRMSVKMIGVCPTGSHG